jgi:hypothetical protein
VKEMDERDRILSTEYSFKFDKLRQNRMVVSHYKYGYIKENAEKGCVKYIPTLEKRLQAYKDTGNTEFLADIANFAMIEFMYPQHPGAYFEATDSDKSPGLVGMSTNEIKAFKEQHQNEL